jgi:hypothetical protein
MFGRNIWSEAVHVSWENLSVIALVVVALLLLLIVSDYFGLSASSTGIGSTLIWILLAIAGHATVLKGRSGLKSIDNTVMMPFLYRTMGLIGLTLVPVFIGIFLTISYGETAIYLTVLLIAGISSILVLGKWGTWLPAVVAGGDRSLRSAGRRGRTVFGYVVSRLLAGPGILTIASFGAYFFLIGLFDLQALVWTDEGPQIREILISLLFTISQAFVTVMTAVILSRAYLMTEMATAAPLSPNGVAGR